MVVGLAKKSRDAQVLSARLGSLELEDGSCLDHDSDDVCSASTTNQTTDKSCPSQSLFQIVTYFYNSFKTFTPH
jgi:hypothetical protein